MQMQVLDWGFIIQPSACEHSMPGQSCLCFQAYWLQTSAVSWLCGEALKAAARIHTARGRCLAIKQQQWAHTHTSMTASLRSKISCFTTRLVYDGNLDLGDLNG